MWEEYLKVEKLASILDIDLVSAKELMDGTISFTNEELECVASHLGIEINALDSID